MSKCYRQRKAIDYEGTFSLVMRFSYIYLMLMTIIHLDVALFQMDVKTTILSKELDKLEKVLALQ